MGYLRNWCKNSVRVRIIIIVVVEIEIREIGGVGIVAEIGPQRESETTQMVEREAEKQIQDFVAA